MRTLRPALVLLALFTVAAAWYIRSLVTGGGAPWLGRPRRAARSCSRDGRAVGSRWSASLHQPGLLLGPALGHRATTPYDAAASGGTNLGPRDPAADRRAVAERIAALRRGDPGDARAVPVDLVTASGVGARPAHQPGGRALPGRAGRRRARPAEAEVAALVEAPRRAADARVARRAGSTCWLNSRSTAGSSSNSTRAVQ
jgi:K+-transporting ATPase ATPase C chain